MGRMTLLGVGSGVVSSGAVSNPLDLQFASGSFAKAGMSYGSLSAVSGASVTTPAAFAYALDGSLVAKTANAGRYDTGGLLVEQSSTNVVANSTDVSNAEFSSYQSTVSTGAATAPDGVGAGQKITANAANDVHSVYSTNGYTITAGSTWTQSTFVKAAGVGYAHLELAKVDDSTGLEAIINLSNGAIAGDALGTGTLKGAVAIPAGNDWYCSAISGIIDSSTTQLFIEVDCSAPTTAQFIGNGSDGIYTWGQQVEALAFATSPIKTTGSSATRAADNVSVALTPPSTAFHMDVGFTTTRAVGQARTLFDWNDGTDNNKVILTMDSTNHLVLTVINGGTPTTIATEGGTPAAARSATATVLWTGTQWTLQVNGSIVATTTASKPAVTTMQIGQNRAMTQAMNDLITSLTVYPN